MEYFVKLKGETTNKDTIEQTKKMLNFNIKESLEIQRSMKGIKQLFLNDCIPSYFWFSSSTIDTIHKT